MNLILILTLFLFSFYHPRREIFLLFSGSMLMHWVCVLFVTNDVFYYTFDAIIVTIVAESLRHFKPVTLLHTLMQKVCLSCVMVDIIGLMLWVMYKPPFLYNMMYSFIYIIVLYAMFNRYTYEPTHNGSVFRFYHNGFSSDKNHSVNNGNFL